MGSSDAGEQETMGQPAGGGYASRKGRITPRQLWERLERKESDQTQEPQDDQPPEPGARTPGAPTPDKDGYLKVRLPSQEPPPEAETTPPDDTPPQATAPDEQTAQASLDEGDADGAADQEPSAQESGEHEPSDEPSDEPSAQQPDENETPQMVEPHMQPGNMKYPYATHAPPPDGVAGIVSPPGGERRIPTGLVLGILIIVASAIIGLSLINLHKTIGGLERRIAAIERTTSPTPAEPPPAP